MTARFRKRKTHVRTATVGSTVRLEEPNSSRGQKQPVTIIASERFVGGFVDFLREHAVVGLAIGFVIGTQAQTLVKQLVASFIDPLFQLFFGKALSNRTFTLHFHAHRGVFPWGAFIYTFLNFLFVLAAVYILFKALKLDKLDKKEEEELEAE